MSGSRIELDGNVEEKDGQQFVSGRGLYGDGYTRILRLEPHGFSSQPVKGARGLLFSPNGNPDEAYVIGAESAGLRPTGIPSGGTAIYDSSGNIISLVGSRIRLVAPEFLFVGNVEVVGNIHATGTIIDDGGNTNHHSH